MGSSSCDAAVDNEKSHELFLYIFSSPVRMNRKSNNTAIDVGVGNGGGASVS